MSSNVTVCLTVCIGCCPGDGHDLPKHVGTNFNIYWSTVFILYGVVCWIYCNKSFRMYTVKMYCKLGGRGGFVTYPWS